MSGKGPIAKEHQIVGTINIDAPVTCEMVHDMLCTALDSDYGGSNYWIKSWKATKKAAEVKGAEYTWEVITFGEKLIFVDKEDEVFEIELTDYLEGLKAYCIASKQTPDAVYENDDANSADSILQYAVFGKQVYS